MKMMGVVLDMVLAVGEVNEVAWLRSLNSYGLLYTHLGFGGLKLVGVHLTP